MDGLKIVELIIDDSEENGLDGVALVENPAHEALFEYFSKEEEPYYVLNEEESACVINMMLQYGEPQGKLESEGWVIKSVRKLNRKEFTQIIATPNQPSYLDTDEVRFRFKYIGPRDSKNRTFCKDLMTANRVYRAEDIEQMSRLSVNPVGPEGYSIMEFRGSYNCRHAWGILQYVPEGTIINKSTVRKGVIPDTDDVLPGPDTRTTATIEAGNTPPRVP